MGARERRVLGHSSWSPSGSGGQLPSRGLRAAGRARGSGHASGVPPVCLKLQESTSSCRCAGVLPNGFGSSYLYFKTCSFFGVFDSRSKLVEICLRSRRFV